MNYSDLRRHIETEYGLCDLTLEERQGKLLSRNFVVRTESGATFFLKAEGSYRTDSCLRTMRTIQLQLDLDGLRVPIIIPTLGGSLSIWHGNCRYSLMSYVEGTTRVSEPSLMRRLGEIIGRLHQSLAQVDLCLPPVARLWYTVHDYERYIAILERFQISSHADPLASGIKAALPEILCMTRECYGVVKHLSRSQWVHGDLQAGNICFDYCKGHGILDYGDIHVGHPFEDLATCLYSLCCDVNGWAFGKMEDLLFGYTSITNCGELELLPPFIFLELTKEITQFMPNWQVLNALPIARKALEFFWSRLGWTSRIINGMLVREGSHL